MVKNGKMKPPSSEDPVAQELVEIKKLLVFYLIREGASQEDIASALGVNQSSISRRFGGAVRKSTKKR